MNPTGNPIPTCGGPLRYSISALLIVLLLGLLPAACGSPEGRTVSQGDATQEQPRTDPRPPDLL